MLLSLLKIASLTDLSYNSGGGLAGSILPPLCLTGSLIPLHYTYKSIMSDPMREKQALSRYFSLAVAVLACKAYKIAALYNKSIVITILKIIGLW